jgi:RNA polymerase sigma factor (TIGR02999 family)
MSEVTRILDTIEQGDPQAGGELLPLVYEELRKLAARRLADEAPGQTLQATALVHEAYLRLVGDGDRPWNSRGHFFAAAAHAMRRILIERARQRQRLRHGGAMQRLDLDNLLLTGEGDPGPILALDEALERLARDEPVIGEVVRLRFFAGLPIDETAAALGISVRTANRHWSYARAWLYQQVTEQDASGG